ITNSHGRLDRPGLYSVGAEPVTVPVFATDAEAPMLGKDRWEQICRLYSVEGMNISRIARATDLDRKTVRRCVRKAQWRAYQRQAAAATLMSPHAAWLTERAPQVRYSARILFQELCATRGFSGGYDTVKIAVRPLRAQAALDSLTQCRFETPPGEQSQVDWGEVRVAFDSGPAKIHVFVLTLGYSRRGFALGFEHERIGSLMAAHEAAFEHFGGHTAELLYDRMRTVVLGSEDGKPRWNPTFKAFAEYWGFEPRLCRPYRAQTKGKVESGVKYVKRNFLPGRRFRDLADFNEQLAAWLAEVADVRVHGTTHQRPIDRFAEEAPALVRTLGEPSFLQAMARERVVAEDWLVSIDTNRYSVPCTLIGKTVQVLRVGGDWQISHQGRLVAEHPVLAGRYQLSVHPAHGPGAIARNARKRFGTPAAPAARLAAPLPEVELRDLAVYEQLFGLAA
ncbi:MAG: IS21 family transposase, partial [Burkholderiales bacterium]